MRYILLIGFSLLLALPSGAQFIHADHKKAVALEQRPLIVALFDLEEEADSHCDSVHMQFYNETIRQLLPEYWDLSDSIIFMNSKRVAAIIASKSSDYVIFSAGPSIEGQQSSGDIFWYPSFTFMLYLSEDGRKFDTRMVDRGLYSTPLMPDMEMTGQLFRGKYIFKLSFFNMYLSENDLVFAIKQFSMNIHEALQNKQARRGIYARKIAKETTALLESKTLLIPDNLDPETSSRQYSKYYSYPYVLASQEKISGVIAERSSDHAYIHYLWSDHQRMYQAYIIDAATSQVLAVFRPGKIEINTAVDCPGAGTSYRSDFRMKARRLKSIR